MVHISKDLYKCKELSAIFSLDAKLDEWLKLRCLPSFMKRGFQLVPSDLIPEVDEKLVLHEAERKVLVEKFILVFETAVKDAKERLKELFNPSDYPTVDEVRAAFTFKFEYIEYTPSNTLKAVSKAMYDREKQKAENSWKEASFLLVGVLRKRTQEMVEHMVKLVTPKEEGKRKLTFRKDSLNKINSFLEKIDSLNLVNDIELKKFTDQAKNLLEGVTPASLKSDEGLRTSIQSAFTEMNKSLEKLVVDAPIRSIRFED
jgi:hypothetical protein